ncbi:uncharacterized protein RCO7_14272 [Rhynchosporium graminicola]|uniref:Uncharacterized protein n=1 Tax=Rhynchosporium graminicola TaxID=2792576 RepID=A0A1E1K5W0_9HELO|nr:uncharacterized protein RCO7_14272 [Rhynchosporium commune]
MTSLCPIGPIVLSEHLESITEKSDKLIAYPMRCVCVLNIEQADEPHPNSHCHAYTIVSHITKIDDDDQVFLLDFIHDNSSNAPSKSASAVMIYTACQGDLSTEPNKWSLSSSLRKARDRDNFTLTQPHSPNNHK